MLVTFLVAAMKYLVRVSLRVEVFILTYTFRKCTPSWKGRDGSRDWRPASHTAYVVSNLRTVRK